MGTIEQSEIRNPKSAIAFSWRAVLVLAIPLFAFLTLAVTFDLGRLMLSYPDYDLTPYLAARSLAADGDVAYTGRDSDAYFREALRRPSHFTLVKKKILSGQGQYREYLAFYTRILPVYLMLPFTALLGFRGILLLHAILIGLLYAAGYLYYSREKDTGVRPALNTLVYYTLVPLPILALIPSHHLLLFTLLSLSLFAGLRRRTLASAVLLAAAFSIQPWSLLLGLLLISYWQYTGVRSEPVRFIVLLALACFAAWALQTVTYPPDRISEARIVRGFPQKTITESWSSLPRAPEGNGVTAPSFQRVQDFLFGRTAGFFLYGFTALALFLSGLWIWRDRLINRSLLFLLLVLIVISFLQPFSWNITGFFDDFWLMLAAVAFFLRPLIRPVKLFVPVVAVSSLFVAPLLVNPYGALASRYYYTTVFPYTIFPMELSLLGNTGQTADPAYQLPFRGGTVYLLNDQYYKEGDFLWVKGESSVEFIIEAKQKTGLPVLTIQNGSIENRVRVDLGGASDTFYLQASERAQRPLDGYFGKARSFEGRFFLHGTITSSNGYVPKLLSRDNTDFRYLGCQIHLTHTLPETTSEKPGP